MKKLTIILITFLLAFRMVGANAQVNNNDSKKEKKIERKIEKKKLKSIVISKVSDASKNSFQNDFGNIQDVTWIKTDEYEEAIFTKGGHKMNAYYDNKAQLIGTTTLKTFADLPQQGQTNLKILFRNFAIKQVIFYNDNEPNKTPLKLYGKVIEDTDTFLVEMVYGFRRYVVYIDQKGRVSLFTTF